jgi:hypothetical protein
MSAAGTSATFTRRGSMSGSEPFSDISASPDHVGQFTALFVAPSRFPGGSARAASAQVASSFTVERARPESPLWVILRQWRIQLLRAMASISRAKLVIRLFRPIYLIVARQTLGADGKDHRANSVHGPFPKSVRKHPLQRVRGSATASLRSTKEALP